MSKMYTRLLTAGKVLRSSEVAPLASVPNYLKEKLQGAPLEVMEKMVAGYQVLSPEDKKLVQKVAGPWTELSLDEKAVLYDRQYEQSWYEEEEERNTSGYFKDGA